MRQRLNIFWIRFPVLRAKAERGEILFGTVDTWLIWRLTGGLHVTDVSNASRTMLCNIGKVEWDQELLDIFRIPRDAALDSRFE